MLIALYGIVSICGFWFCLRRPKLLPILLVITMPTGNFQYELGITLSLAKVVLIIFFITLPAQAFSVPHILLRLRLPWSIWALMAALAVITALHYDDFNVNTLQSFEGFRGPALRPFVQMVSLLLRIGALVLVTVWVLDRRSVWALYKTVLVMSTLIALYGIYQVVGYYAGWPVMSIFRPVEGMQGGFGMFSTGSLNIFRLGSFVGEPKEAAKFLLPSLIMIISARVLHLSQLRGWLSSAPNLWLHSVALVLTFSTSALFAFLLSLPVLLHFWWLYGSHEQRRAILRAVVLFLLFTLCATGAVGYKLAQNLLAARTVERVAASDYPEKAALQFLDENPYYILSGVGLGNTSFRIRPYFDQDYLRPLTVSLDSTYLQVLLDGGIIALLLYLMFLYEPIARALRLLKRNNLGEDGYLLVLTLCMCTVVAVLNAFATTDLNGQVWLYWGVLISICSILSSQPIVSGEVGR